jgi:hypothetical protein
MQLQPGDTFADEAGTWEVVTRLTSEGGGKNVTGRSRAPAIRERFASSGGRPYVGRSRAAPLTRLQVGIIHLALSLLPK